VAWPPAKKANGETLDKLKAAGMQILPPSAQLKADMKKVGDTMLKEWLDKAGPEGKQLVDAFRSRPSRAQAARRAVRRRGAWLAALCMVGLLVMVLLSIVGRQLHFHLPGTDAYAGYLMAAAGFLALAHTLKRGEHIRVTLLLSALHGRARRALEIWSLAAATLLAAVGLVRLPAVVAVASSTTSPPATTPRRCGSRSWHGGGHR
jgi:hypothetical protein